MDKDFYKQFLDRMTCRGVGCLVELVKCPTQQAQRSYLASLEPLDLIATGMICKDYCLDFQNYRHFSQIKSSLEKQGQTIKNLNEYQISKRFTGLVYQNTILQDLYRTQPFVDGISQNNVIEQEVARRSYEVQQQYLNMIDLVANDFRTAGNLKKNFKDCRLTEKSRSKMDDLLFTNFPTVTEGEKEDLRITLTSVLSYGREIFSGLNILSADEYVTYLNPEQKAMLRIYVNYEREKVKGRPEAELTYQMLSSIDGVIEHQLKTSTIRDNQGQYYVTNSPIPYRQLASVTNSDKLQGLDIDGVVNTGQMTDAQYFGIKKVLDDCNQKLEAVKAYEPEGIYR